MSRIARSAFLTFVSILVVGVAASGVMAEATSNIGGMRGDERNEAKIRALYDEFEADWNAHDVAKLIEHWAIDGDHVEPDGTEADGNDAIKQLLEGQHGGAFKDSMLDLTIEDVFFLSTSIALVDGTYKVAGIVTPDGTAIPARSGRYTAVLLDEQGGWHIAASRLMIPAGLPYKPQ